MEFILDPVKALGGFPGGLCLLEEFGIDRLSGEQGFLFFERLDACLQFRQFRFQRFQLVRLLLALPRFQAPLLFPNTPAGFSSSIRRLRSPVAVVFPEPLFAGFFLEVIKFRNTRSGTRG